MRALQTGKTAGPRDTKSANVQSSNDVIADHNLRRGKIDAQEVRIGARIRCLRLSKGYSLRRLADLVGCSESFVSKVENNKIRPSLVMLHRLAAQLEINVGTLFADRKKIGGPVTILRDNRRPLIRVDADWQGSGLGLEPVIPHPDATLLQANILHVAPGGWSDETLQHEGEEFGYLISGNLELVVGGTAYVLEAGDSFFFPSPLPHGYRNQGRKTARVLWVNSPPSF